MPNKDSVNKKPILIIIAGPNGSGKTSVTQQILEHQWIEDCTYINPDNIAKEKFGDWNSPKAVLKAVKLATKIRYNCLKKKESLIFETVLSTPEKIDFIKEAKKQGYFVRLFFINTDNPIINAKRVAQRVSEGGHDVPISKIISRYSKSLANGCVATKIVDRAYFYDNSIDDKSPRLIFRTKNGEIANEYGKYSEWTKKAKDFIS
jgi:predicted ABC-type ATPase